MDGQIHQYFSAGTSELPPDVLFELESIARMHGMSAEDMFYKWESYCIKRDMDATELDMGTVRAFKQDILDSLERSSRQHVVQAKSEKKSVGATPRAGGTRAIVGGAGGGGGDLFGMLDGLVPNTPTAGPKLGRAAGQSGSTRKRQPYETPTVSRIRLDVASSSPVGVGDHLASMNNTLPPPSSFVDRANAGEVVEQLNEHLVEAAPPPAPYPEPRVKLKAHSDQKKFAYKTMAMKLADASEALDDRIDEFTQIVAEHHALEPDALGNAATQGTSQIVAVGRIASDSVADGRLARTSVVLETSRRSGGGHRVPLNFGKVASYAVFPGKMVALKGINSSGAEFVVDEVLEVPLLPNAASAMDVMAVHRELLRGSSEAMDEDGEPQPLSIFFASGPYTADDNLDFEPLHELCGKAGDEYVDLVVLAGPFVDADHPLIASGDFDLPEGASHNPDTATLSTVFKYLFAPALARLASANPSVSVVLVPSVRDVIDKHTAWPQDVPARRDLGLPRCVRIVTNPMTVAVNDAVLGVSSHDALFEIKAEELVGGSRPSETPTRLASHLLEQRHYYPMFPPLDRKRLPKTGTEEGIATGAMLDTTYLNLGEMVTVRPDIMFVPSALPPFVRIVQGVVVLNTGFLSKRRGAGTYARMTLHAPTLEVEESGMVPHNVYKRARVELVRI